jgi:hypothetical protein
MLGVQCEIFGFEKGGKHFRPENRHEECNAKLYC